MEKLSMGKWQFTSKKPIKRAYERKDSATKAWLEEIYPKIKKEAKKDNADIWWCDETACQNLANNLKGYAPIGTYNKPVLEHTAKKFKINMISAITNTGKSMFSLYDESIKIDSFIEFCKKVIDSNNGKKVFLIVDNLRVHHAKLVIAWEEENKDKIKLFYLPAYSPDYNPDEYLNQDYKQSANKNEDDFKNWCEGNTGVPIIDASMRYLNQTGLMHNRLRMVTSSYLTKNLLIDWRKGEEYFALKLLDYEASSNIGSWQWAAS